MEKASPYSLAANSMAERANRTVFEGTRTLLDEAGLPHSFWAEAAATFCYVEGFVPSARLPDDVPIKVWTQKRHDVSHLRPFGCKCWATLPDVRTGETLARQAVYIGRRRYRLYIPSSKTFLESRDVRFEAGEPKRTRTRAVPDQIRLRICHSAHHAKRSEYGVCSAPIYTNKHTF